MSNINLEEMEKEVMDGLKDFQRETVCRIDSLFKKGQNRVLVADEVGLGKTLVAKGVIAKFANYRNQKEEDNLIKVVYVCSNSAIANQNLEDLNINDSLDVENSFTSRLSMQHLNIFRQENALNDSEINVQLIPLTPQTSFKVDKSQGTIDERALMYAVLSRIRDFSGYESILSRIFRYTASETSWDKVKQKWGCKVDDCGEKYMKYMECMLWRGIDKNNYNCPKMDDESEDYSKHVQDLIKFCMNNKEKEWDLKDKKDKCIKYIKNFRNVFASISLEKLNADLIIMDEFQRFKDLLNCDEESDLAKLTRKFFNEDVRILLLSATPYKLYSTLEEISNENVDSHYSEFFELIDFLKKSQKEQEKFKEVWSDYSISLREFDEGNISLIDAKLKAENELYKNICRTERITEEDLNDIINNGGVNQIDVLNEDIESYIKVQKLLDETVKINVPIDYIKSTPYIMSFMENYQLKKEIIEYFKEHSDDLGKMEDDLFWLNKNEINNYQRISPNNGRLNFLMDNVFKDNESHLLWVPPSMPYYEFGGVFRNHEGFSKTLIFSSWEMVPRMISSLVSYEAERQTFGQLRSNVKYFAPEYNNSSSKRSSSRMRFLKNYDFYNTPRIDIQIPVLMLLYPSSFLSDVYDPIDCLNRKLSINQIEEEIKIKIKQRVMDIKSRDDGDVDFRWYSLAPLLLDDKKYVVSWFDKFERLCNSDKTFGERYYKRFSKLPSLYESYENKLGRKPDDLIDVLCDIAIASPAACAYRTYEREIPDDDSMISYLDAPTQIARRFVRYMNLPESISVIDLHFNVDSEWSYWKSVLKYSKEGNLQAVFDEYVHLLSKPGKNTKKSFGKLNNKCLASFEYITTRLSFDTFNNFKSRIENDDSSDGADKNKNGSLDKFRIHYAASFAKERSDGENSNRKKTVIDAFNSPFRPFVLASTSIGQEGLDFHKYCRKIVHWNLPSNPIDLEQREGRINRFKSLSIRQNIAKRYVEYGNFDVNVWSDLFEWAIDAEGNESSDLIPFWGLNKYYENLKIERIFPMYPHSIDELKYDRLIDVLSLYRLTLGQPRQEDLINSILDYELEDDEKEDIKKLFINLSPYYKNKYDKQAQMEESK